MTNTILYSACTGSIKHHIQNFYIEYSACKMTIFIQSYCSHQMAIFPPLCSLNGYKIFSEALLIYSSFVRAPTENTILLWSTAAAAVQFHQHKCFTNTCTKSIGLRKTLLQTTGICFLVALVDCINFFFHAILNILKCGLFGENTVWINISVIYFVDVYWPSLFKDKCKKR